jgi:outer membrane murein-binding lipoprotein Lpp
VSALIVWLLSNPTVLAIGAGIIGALGFGFQQRLAGARAERNRQATKDLAAAQDRVEMNREATDIERQTAGMTDDQARKEAAPWVRR